MGPAPKWWGNLPKTLSITLPCWEPKVACDMFLDLYNKLMDGYGAEEQISV
jgi:hypothetical protein